MSVVDGSNISDELRATIRKEAVSQVSKWLIGLLAALAGFAVLGWWVLLKPWLIGELRGNPAGTVIAVDARERCPEPWREFAPLAGRVVVGAGRSENLTSRAVGDRAGSEQLVLSEAQLPPHRHPIAAVLTSEALGSRRGWTDNNGGWWPGRVWIRPADATDANASPQDQSQRGSRSTEVQGGPAQPIDVMPPFYVLRYCTL